MSIFHLPDLGEGLAEAEIRGWYIQVGDTVTVDQPMLSLETAKAVVDIPAPRAGKITQLFGKAGDFIKTGAPLVEFEGELKQKDHGTVVGHLEESGHVLKENEMKVGVVKPMSATKAMPAVRQLAKELKVDLNKIKPTGPQGQITFEDVNKAARHPAASDAAVETLRGVRRTMAMTATKSHQEIVPVTLMDDADITDFRDAQDVTVSLLQAMVKAVGREPALNAWYDGKTMERVLHQAIHIGIAVDTAEGLFVPVIKNAEKKNALELRMTVDVLKEALRERTIKPDDLQGATLTLTNFGLFAGRYANPIIIPPMVAILGCGRIRDEARVHQGNIMIRKIAPLSLTFDHRCITGGEAARFLGAVIQFLEAHP